jgi:hypothetical protein
MRRNEGRETWHRLLNWEKGQSASETLSAQILGIEGYKDIDPIHPRGGKDGGKDILCTKDGIKFIAACYFPRGEKSFKEISTKFDKDLAGANKNNAEGIAFVTNQELKNSERKSLEKKAGSIKLDVFHLERIALILDSPQGYAARREFLDIEMNDEERVACTPSNSFQKPISDKVQIKRGIFHTCSDCGFEYVIDDPHGFMSAQLESQRLIRNSLIGLIMSNASSHFPHKSIVTTCTKCGNIDEIV